jgi:hypothetical protein
MSPVGANSSSTRGVDSWKVHILRTDYIRMPPCTVPCLAASTPDTTGSKHLCCLSRLVQDKQHKYLLLVVLGVLAVRHGTVEGLFVI